MVEEALHVHLTYSRSTQACVIFGFGESPQQARTRISDFLTWTSISLSFDSTQVV